MTYQIFQTLHKIYEYFKHGNLIPYISTYVFNVAKCEAYNPS